MQTPTRPNKPDRLAVYTAEHIASIFDKAILQDEASVETALGCFERYLYGSVANASEELLGAVRFFPELVEFVVCALSNGAFPILETFVLEGFPKTAADFVSDTRTVLLSRLSKSLLFPYDRAFEEAPELIARRQSVEDAASILREISSVSLPDGPTEGTNTSEDPKRLAKRKAQARRRSSAASIPTPILNKAPFLRLGMSPPATRPEADALATSVLEEQRNALQFYLRTIRGEPHATFFRMAYLPPTARIDGPPSPDSTISGKEYNRDELTAQPAGRSLSSTLCSEDLKGFGAWPIVSSPRAQRDLRKARKEDRKKYEIIVKKIQELSTGHFSDDNHKKLTGIDVGVPIYEAKMSRNLRLVYHIHCISELGSNVEKQAIRIFGVYTHEQLDHGGFWDTVGRTLARQGPEYRKRCLARERATYRRGDNVVVPAQFPPRQADVDTTDVSVAAPDLSKEQMEELRSLVLEGYVNFSRDFLKAILADQDVAHVFNVSQTEKEIIEYRHSCIVIGRSGTGKTTSILFKMFGNERSWEALGEGVMGSKPRQLFVTQSRILAEKVEEYYDKLRLSLTTAKCTPEELKGMAAKGSVPARQRAVDADEEVYWRVDRPKRYGALQDSHFPLFLTYDHLCWLLENEYQHRLSEVEKQEGARRTRRQVLQRRARDESGGSDTTSVISYKTFLGTYWSHFPQDLTKGLNPDIVFSEFLGVIQGSKRALDSQSGYLDRDSYCTNGPRSIVTASDQREAIYELFMRYRKEKKQLWQRDAADRTYELVKAFKEKGLPGRPVDFLYVDEAQDNLLIDTFVLRTLCPNLSGMFWAGDTAQTISAGSAFRFSELKAFLHDCAVTTPIGFSGSSPVEPAMFSLTANFRSHDGIVNCAASIVELITRHWSDSMDTLPQEKGMVPGPKPIFFWDERSTGYDQFLVEDSGRTVEFGARQCILVRDNAARQRLRSQVGKLGIILTIPESKGLEFDDVLLYDPFMDSTIDYSQWRVVLNSVPGAIAPQYDDTRHSGVCRELKSLYVAVTRARMNLWIIDCSQKGEPMRHFWTAAGLIENHNPSNPMPRLAVSSGKQEWADVAWSLFNKRQYSEAGMAFERGGLQKEAQVARAYHLRDLAESSSTALRAGDRVSYNVNSSVEVAKAFIKLAQDAIEVDDKCSYHRIAAQWYARAGSDREAAATFYLAGHYESAAKHYRAAGMFEEAIDVVTRHRADVNTSVAEGIISVSKLQFLRKNEINKACSLFQSDAEALDYMAGYGLETPRASLLTQRGRYAEAAECHLSEGKPLEAIRLFMLDGHSRESLSRAAQIVLDGLWALYSFAESPTRVERDSQSDGRDDLRNKLFNIVDKFQGLPIDDNTRNEMKMFQAIERRDIGHILELNRGFARAVPDNSSTRFLCLDCVFTELPDLHSLPIHEIAACFRTFLNYVRLLQRLACDPDPCNNPMLRRIFSFAASEDEDQYILHPDSCISIRFYSQCAENAPGQSGILVPRWEVEKHIKSLLRERLLERVTNQNEACHNLHSIRPCLLFATSGRCPRHDCPQYHAAPTSDGVTAYNVLVRIHMLQIMIYHTLYAADISSDILFRQQRSWLRRLYEALYTPHFKLGSLHLLSSTHIPELLQGRHIAIVWLKDFLNSLEPGSERTLHVFLSNLVRTTRLAMLFDTQGASNELHRIPCMSPPRTRPLALLWRHNVYVIQDLVVAMQGKHVDALDRAVLFLNHVLQRRLPIDIAVLCDFMDELCGSLVAAMRLRSRGGLHDVTLPKSWVARAACGLNALKGKSTRLWGEYATYIKDLLLQVYTGQNEGWHILFENLDLSNRGYHRTRNIFVARICRNLCLWGYNLRSPQLREAILKTMSIIGQGDLILSPVISPYLYATSWNGLAKAVRASTTGSALDEMVQLWHSGEPVPTVDLPNVRRVSFSRHEDIPALLNVEQPMALLATGAVLASNPEARPQHPAIDLPASQAPQNGGDTTITSRPDGPADEGLLEEHPPHADSEESNAPDETETVAPIEFKLSDHELAAATKIAEAFKQYQQRVRGEHNALKERRRRIYTQFRTRALNEVWSSRTARLLFLGALPHAYLALECTRNHLSAAEAHAKEKLMVIDHRELENLQATLDNVTELLKRASELHQQLGPLTSTYQQCDHEDIKIYIHRTATFVHGVEADMETTFEWAEDIALAAIPLAELPHPKAK